jgi:hypothetical protein
MKFREFLSAVPKPAKTVASCICGCAVVIGMVAGFLEGQNNGQVFVHGVALPVSGAIAGVALGLLAGMAAGALIAAWVLCLGYVYGDARRRCMPPVLWVLIAALVPNLLGFLLYFGLRRPIALPCAHCGQAITADQLFCSWCGQQRPTSFGANVSQSDHPGLGTSAGV